MKSREVTLGVERILPGTLRSTYKDMTGSFGLHKNYDFNWTQIFFLPGGCALYIAPFLGVNERKLVFLCGKRKC